VLPDVNQKIAVRLSDWRGELYSRVEDAGDGILMIALPSDGTTVHTLAVGRQVTIEWITSRGLACTPGVVDGRARDGRVPMLSIAVTGETTLVQRRDYVRAEAFVPVTITLARENAEPVTGITLDVSGGGLRARLPIAAAVDDIVRVALELEEGEIAAVARITRRIDENTIAFQFTEISQPSREKLIRFVFAAHRRAHLAAKQPA
jgi:c-di-GMP-binding flagellar brake protein YcgR